MLSSVEATPRLSPALRWLLVRSSLARRLVVPGLVARQYRAFYGRPLDRRHARTLPEIINWAKAWGGLERYAPFADKYLVRRYVASVVGEEHLVPLLAVADRAADIDWDALPSAFVLKATHGSTMNIIVRDKASADRAAICARMDRWLSEPFFHRGLEFQYAHIHPRVIAEAYLGDPARTPPDYKINCARGRALLFQIDHDRHADHTRVLLDMDWRVLPTCDDGVPAMTDPPPPPACLPSLLDIVSRLSRPFAFVRVDCYLLDDRVYVGELTFTPAQGLFRTEPSEYDLVMGEGIDINDYRRPLEVDPRIFDEP